MNSQNFDFDYKKLLDNFLSGSQVAITIAFIGIYGAFSSFYKIEPTEHGVVTRLGAFNHIADPGPHRHGIHPF